MSHIVLYRPPYSSLHPVSTSVFFDEFAQFLENVVLCPEVPVISGDFNLHLDDLRDNGTKKLIYGFSGNVKSFATRFWPDPFIGSYLGFNNYSFVG